ncbi:dirigent protein 22-like [Ziziphus jujuba]|uniref:Dirigent protein n=1 Tax=Ziziphus jujuba TaxID=326968 RepID=A0ABM3IWT5_ZIZJJ|nr:dirigent protein 22-like [Ziziphus jujuba]
MAKLTFSLMLLCFVFAMAVVQSTVQGFEENNHEWFQKLQDAKENLTKLHFYFHDVQSGKNATSVKVVEVANTSKSATSFFGEVNMIDNLLTEGPKRRSKLVGRAQGLYGFASQEEMTLIMAMNFVFTSGNYNGSSLTILGHNPVLHQLREMPIVGGTGVFRLARGFAMAKTFSLNTKSGDAIVEYNVTALHY